MRMNQLRPRETPQMSLNVSSILLNIEIATKISKMLPVTPSAPLRVFWIKPLMRRAISLRALTMRSSSANETRELVGVVTELARALVGLLADARALEDGAPWLSI